MPLTSTTISPLLSFNEIVRLLSTYVLDFKTSGSRMSLGKLHGMELNRLSFLLGQAKALSLSPPIAKRG